jgi:hypothetical protein
VKLDARVEAVDPFEVKSASRGNCHRENALAPEVARHQSVHDRAEFAFNSRRLHQP